MVFRGILDLMIAKKTIQKGIDLICYYLVQNFIREG
jgi:hypothetical protein